MTYTTEEKRMIAEIRHKSKMSMLDKIAAAEATYNKATAGHKAILDKTIAEIEDKAKVELKTTIAAGLAEIRNEGEEADNE